MNSAATADYSGSVEVAALADRLFAGEDFMRSRTSRLTCYVLATCMALGSIPGWAQNGPAPRRTKIFAFSQAKDVRELYIAVMGEVENPGTYHLDPSSLNLHSIIQRAGGFKPEANMAIRVIRNGRSHQERYSETKNSSLLPGDLLIVDSHHNAATIGKVHEFEPELETIHASFQERAPQTGVEIAVVNALDYPLIVRLHPERGVGE